MAFLALSVAGQEVDVLSTLKNLLTTTQTTVHRSQEISEEIHHSISYSSTNRESSWSTGIEFWRWKRYAANLAKKLGLSSAEAQEMKMLEDCMVEGGCELKCYGNREVRTSMLDFSCCRIAVVKKYGAMHCAYLTVSQFTMLADKPVTFRISKKCLLWEYDSYTRTVYIPRKITQKHIDLVTEKFLSEIDEMTQISIKAIEEKETEFVKQIETTPCTLAITFRRNCTTGGMKYGL